jgi:hypothetical protein
MRNFDEATITDAVLQRVRAAKDDRIRQVSEALVRHLQPGQQMLVTHVFAAGDQYLDSDVVFGVKDSLIREFAMMPASAAPDGREMAQPYYHLTYDFGLKANSEARRTGDRAA